MREKRWSQPPKAVLIPCSKGLVTFGHLMVSRTTDADAMEDLYSIVHYLDGIAEALQIHSLIFTTLTFLCRQIFRIFFFFFTTDEMIWLNLLHTIHSIPYPLSRRRFPYNSHYTAVFWLDLGLLFFCCNASASICLWLVCMRKCNCQQ